MLAALLVALSCSGITDPRSSEPPGFVAIAPAGSATCALAATGEVFCWGAGIALGNGTGRQQLRPGRVHADVDFAQLTMRGLTCFGCAAPEHACALTAGGTAYCWGSNADGQLGDGTTTHRLAPVRVVGEHNFTSIVAGGRHSCALDRSGVVYCWGGMGAGDLGSQSRNARTVPTPVRDAPAFSAIVAGENHTCGLAAGQAHCWGTNESGQLGTGSTARHARPRPVSGEFLFTSLAAGGQSVCGVTTDRATVCWGSTYDSRPYTGPTTRATPTPIDVGVNFVSLALGWTHACGLDDAGAAFCWGDNELGLWGGDRLGNGTTEGRPAPERVVGGLVFRTLAAGEGHTCGITLTGGAYCWGDNRSGQLGIGSVDQGRTVQMAISASR